MAQELTLEDLPEPSLVTGDVALLRQQALTELALDALSGATPYRLSVDACELISAHLGATAAVETPSGRVESARMSVMQSWFVVPIGEEMRFGQVVVGSATRRSFHRQDVAFVVAIADVLARAGAAHADTETLRHQASHDPLTGLPNRAALQAKLRTVTADQVPIGVLLCDLDGLKQVNDNLGHQRGDELLIAMAQRIRGAARAGDLVARIGGDEFVVVCPMISAEEVQAIGVRIQAETAIPVRMDHYEVTTSVSVGIAMSDTPGDTDALIHRADAAMYRSKHQRRQARRSSDATATVRTEAVAPHPGAETAAPHPADAEMADVCAGEAATATGQLVQPGLT